MSANKKIFSTALKTPSKNEYTNHLAFLAFQLEQRRSVKPQQKKVTSSSESPLADIVTYAFVRGYN